VVVWLSGQAKLHGIYSLVEDGSIGNPLLESFA
jgi:hypothetical protein